MSYYFGQHTIAKRTEIPLTSICFKCEKSVIRSMISLIPHPTKPEHYLAVCPSCILEAQSKTLERV